MEKLSEKAKTYRITIEAIGPEESELNGGVPLIIETDGLFIIGCSKQEDDEKIESEFNTIVHHITPMDIGKALINNKNSNLILKAMMIERIRKTVADNEEG